MELPAPTPKQVIKVLALTRITLAFTSIMASVAVFALVAGVSTLTGNAPLDRINTARFAVPALLVAASASAVSLLVYRRHDRVNQLTGMPTRTDDERVAEVMDMAIMVGETISYENAKKVARYARRSATLARIKGTSWWIMVLGWPLGLLGMWTGIVGGGLALVATATWIGAWIAQRRHAKRHHGEKTAMVTMTACLVTGKKAHA